MVEQQIRPWGVLDPSIVALIHELDRQHFVPKGYQSMAYADIEIPIGCDQYMMAPKLEARLLQALAPRPGDRILEIGTGSGFVTALLAKSGAEVTSVEIFPELLHRAANVLQSNGILDVNLCVGDGAAGWSKGGPWDGILLTASTPSLPQAYKDLLSTNGRLVAIVGRGPAMEAVQIVRRSDQSFAHFSLFETCVAPLVNAQELRVFAL